MRTRLGLLVLSLAVIVSLLVGACVAPQPEAPSEALPTNPPEAKEPFNIGLTGAMTGYAAGTYLPGIEQIRCYFEDLNDRGGIDGRDVKVSIEDNRGEPPRAISQAKNFVERDQASLILVVSPSATYSGVIAECERVNIPLLIAASGTTGELPPDPHRLVFDTAYSGLYDTPTLIAHALRAYDNEAIKIGLLGMDIPVSHLATELLGEAMEREGIEHISDFIPPGTTDLTAVASKFKAENIDYCMYYGPGGVSFMLYDALVKLGWEGALYTAFFEPIEGAIESSRAKGTQILYFGIAAPFQLGYAEHGEIMDMLKKYNAVEINSMSLFSSPTGPIIEYIFKEVGYPATTEEMLKVMNNLEINLAPIYGKRIWTETDHCGPVSGRLYICDKGEVTISGNWFMSDALGKTIEELGPQLPED